MIEKRGFGFWAGNVVLIIGIIIICFPIYIALIASTHTHREIIHPPLPLVPGDLFLQNYREALFSGINVPVLRMMWNSLIMVVYFRFPFRNLCFWLIFMTLMLPVEVRIVPTFEVVVKLKLLNSYAGLTLPLIASATATFLFRQFFMTVPTELIEAARMDGAGPLRFLKDILLPLSRTNIAALFVILFIYGWNQYLWPLLITTEPQMNTIVMGIKQMITGRS